MAADMAKPYFMPNTLPIPGGHVSTETRGRFTDKLIMVGFEPTAAEPKSAVFTFPPHNLSYIALS